jgi:hypothetical protein
VLPSIASSHKAHKARSSGSAASWSALLLVSCSYSVVQADKRCLAKLHTGVQIGIRDQEGVHCLLV